MNEPDHHTTVMGAVTKIILAWIGFLGSVKLTEWAAVVGILSGLAAFVFTALQIYVLWRDKLTTKERRHDLQPDRPQRSRVWNDLGRTRRVAREGELRSDDEDQGPDRGPRSRREGEVSRPGALGP
ncbi:MAG: hypothetical protein AB7U98_13620 [Candidatus Nitrosocosmicus sp.]